MPDFLTLCQQLATKSGAIGRAPTAVTGQTGRQAKAVDWIIDGWKLVQNFSPNWLFLRGRFDSVLSAGASIYTGSSFDIERFSQWDGRISIYDPTIGRKDESELRQITYDAWCSRWDFGEQGEARPIEYAVAPDGSLCLGATPDREYAIRGSFIKSPQVLAANTDVPDMPEQFHDVIVWRAMMLIADHDESAEARAFATPRYTEALAQLVNRQLPDFTVNPDGPMA